LALYSTTVVLPSSEAAFGMSVVLYILQVNAAAFVGLLALQYAGAKLGLVVVSRQAEDRIATA
jgi:hypothetical protein